MSRAALWHQEAGVKEREQSAKNAFRVAVEEGRNSKGKMPLWGSDDSFNLNPMLLNQISSSPYFLKCCNELHDWNAIVDEIYYEVQHVEPWAAGPGSKVPSSAFCLLLRLLTLRCSEKQMQLLLDHPDSPYIRCIGFLYLRYICPPQLIWGWIKPYVMEDNDTFSVLRSGKGGKKDEMTVGQYVRFLFDSSCEYYGTRLPRIESGSARALQVQLLRASKLEERAQSHYSSRVKMDYFTTVGNKVRALYEDEDNPSTWYDAVIDRVIETESCKSRKPKFIVTFPTYGNTETVTLGEIDMPNGDSEFTRSSVFSRERGTKASHHSETEERRYVDRKRWGGDVGNYKYRERRHGYNSRYENRSTSDRGYRKHYSFDQKESYRLDEEKELMNEVLQRERDRTTTEQKRPHYASRAEGEKESFSKNCNGNGDDSRDSKAKPVQSNWDDGFDWKGNDLKSKKRTSQDLAAIAEKKRKLLSRYG